MTNLSYSEYGADRSRATHRPRRGALPGRKPLTRALRATALSRRVSRSAGGAPGPGGTVAYWGVEDIRAAVERLRAMGVEVITDVNDVGGGILIASIRDPWGNEVGLIENPHFDVSAVS